MAPNLPFYADEVIFADLRGNGGSSGHDWQVSGDDKPPANDKPYGTEGSDLIKVVILGAPGVGKSAIAQVIDLS